MNETTQAPAPSATPPTCGRIVLCFGKAWPGPLPGIVVRPTGRPGGCNVRVQDDYDPSTADAPPVLTDAVVYDPLPADGKPDAPYWCEWMPFQAARHAGQAAAAS